MEYIYQVLKEEVNFLQQDESNDMESTFYASKIKQVKSLLAETKKNIINYEQQIDQYAEIYQNQFLKYEIKLKKKKNF